MQSFKFKTLSVAVLAALSAPVFANTADVQLETIEITAQQGVKNKTNVVTTEVANKRTETDLRGLLNEEPAINFGGGNGTSQWWTIRGMGQDQIDVKVDNAYTDTQIFHHQGRFTLDPSLVKIVSVQKGAGSASAGIGATSGSIVAKTLDAKELLENSRNENFGFKVNSGYSSNKGHNYGASVFGKVGAVDALVAGNWVNNEDYKGGNGYQNLYGSNVVKNSALDQHGLLAKVGVDVGDKHRFVLSHREELHKGTRALREEFDFSQSWWASARLNAAQTAAGYFLDRSDVAGYDENGVANSWYVHDANGRVVYDANNNPTYREYTQETSMLEYEGKNLGFADRVDANVYKMEISRRDANTAGVLGAAAAIQTTGANVNFDSKVGANTLLKYGVNYRHQEANPSGASVNQEKTDTGVYAEVIGEIGQVTLTGGLRWDQFDYTATNGTKAKNDDLNPSVGVIYQITPTLSLSANHNYATRSPRLREVAVSGANNVRVESGLKAERARNTEVGFNYNNGNFSADGSYFWQRVENAIDLSDCEGTVSGRNCNGTFHLYNAGEIKNKGYELGLAYRFNGLVDGLLARVSMAYQEPTIYGSVTDTNTAAVWQGRTYTGSLAYQLQNYPVELGWRGRVVEDGVGTPSRGSSTNTTAEVRKGYNTHDFYVNWKPLHNDSLNVNFAVNNAFNESYKPHSQRAGNNSLPGVGRDVRVGFNYTF